MNFNYVKPSKVRLISLIILILLNTGLFSQTNNELTHISFSGKVIQKKYDDFQPIDSIKKTKRMTKNDWAPIIDATWGYGLPTEQKLDIFDDVCNYIDTDYGAFVNYDVNIDSLRNLFRPEIENGISRGRFAGIMSHIIFTLKDYHTIISDNYVIYGKPINPGIPIFILGTYGNNNRFGACLTPLPDSTLLIFKALQNHRLGLEAGDLVLGYDGILWKQLYKQIIEAQLPIQFRYTGSTNESSTHVLLQSAGQNWHLFDTIDIVKYGTGDTLHLSVSPLQYQNGNIWGNEQLPVPGAPMPDPFIDDYVSWGIVEGTQIGYIYVNAWFWEGMNGKSYRIGEQFYNAVDSLMFHNPTIGMIIDFRSNPGGGPDQKRGGFSLLFNEYIEKTGFVERGDPNNHLDMVAHTSSYYGNPQNFAIPGDPSTFFNKPIAVLTGPGAGSAADWSSVQMRFHPMVNVFGKPSNGGFTLTTTPNLNYSGWHFQYASACGILFDNNQLMAHIGCPVDSEVWLNQDDVANGYDTVVNTAIEWINGITDVEEYPDKLPTQFCLENNYPNPFNPSTTINYSLPNSVYVSLIIYNIIGQEIKVLIDEYQTNGYKTVTWDGTDESGSKAASGIYLYRVNSRNFTQSKKMILLK